MTKARDLGDNAQNTKPKVINAKGDLIVGTGSDAADRLAVSDNGSTLVADSSATTGLRWQGNYAVGKNVLINGNMDWWQRGTSTAAIANGAYLADRWKTVLSGTSINATFSQQTTVPNGGSKYSARLQQLTNNATSVSEFGFRQSIEGANCYQLIGNQITVSFWYRSSVTGSHFVRIGASALTGGTDTTQSFTVNAADTWEKKSLTFSSFASVTAMNVADNAEGAIIDVGIRTFGSGGTSTVSTNAYFQITQVMIEAGSVATAFQRAAATLAGELAACQRYYYVHASGNTKAIGTGFYQSATEVNGSVQFPVTMRTAPSLVVASGTDYYGIRTNGVYDYFDTFVIFLPTQNTAIIYRDANVSGTAGQAGFLLTNNVSSSIAFNSEL